MSMNCATPSSAVGAGGHRCRDLTCAASQGVGANCCEPFHRSYFEDSADYRRWVADHKVGSGGKRLLNSCQEIQQDGPGESDRCEVHHGEMWRDGSDLLYRISEAGIGRYVHIAGQDEIGPPPVWRNRDDDRETVSRW
jgi:hypothetical protein